jgi:hypothetical protein
MLILSMRSIDSGQKNRKRTETPVVEFRQRMARLKRLTPLLEVFVWPNSISYGTMIRDTPSDAKIVSVTNEKRQGPAGGHAIC